MKRAGRRLLESQLHAGVYRGILAEVIVAAVRRDERHSQHPDRYPKLRQSYHGNKAVEIHSDYARATYEQFIAQTTKVGDIVTDIAKESYRPFEGMLAKSAGR